MVDPKDLVRVGIQYGHQAKWWCPKMQPYIWGIKNKVHLINVATTAHLLEQAAQFLEQVAAEGKTILWVGTKKVARTPIKEAAESIKSPFVTHRLIGGILTNYPMVRKSVTKLMHLQDVLAKSSEYPYTKKELNSISKQVERLKENIGGIVNLQWPVGAVVVVDVRKELAIIKEAHTLGIPVVALVDTNGDPSLANYVIPGNDDSQAAIKFVVDYLAQAVARGKERATPTQAAALPTESAPVDQRPYVLAEDEESSTVTAEKRGVKPARAARPVGARTSRPSTAGRKRSA